MICAPYAGVDRPSLGLSILKSHAVNLGHDVSINYVNIDFVEHFGLSDYQKMVNSSPVDMAGECLISRIYHSSLVELNEEDLEIRQWYIDKGKELAFKGSDIYCFTCLFQQIRPSLWLAEEIKKIRPKSIIVFGGAALDYPMGEQLFNSFKFVDCLFMGESEQTFVDYLNSVSKNEIYRHPSVLIRNQDIPLMTRAATLADLNVSCAPDYEDYFERFRGSVLPIFIKPYIFYETSRGCSWGQRAQCTFCGLNGGSIGYRAKDPDKVIAEINYLKELYSNDIDELAFVDNIIPQNFYREMLPKLIDNKSNITYFYEIKSNANYEELLSLKNAKVMRIQPGIESLSTHILKSMKKGVTAIQNISVLVNSARLGIDVDWNILLNIPGETDESVESMFDVIPLLYHLQPPDASSPFRLDRHSPVFLNPIENGIKNIIPVKSYFYMYPELNEDEVFNLAYHFDFDENRTKKRIHLHHKIQDMIDFWKSGKYSLTHTVENTGIVKISDSRFENIADYKLTKSCSDLYRYILSEKNSISIRKLTDFDVEDLNFLLSNRLLYKEFDRVIALSLEN